MSINRGYYKTEEEFDLDMNFQSRTTVNHSHEKSHTYDEAIDLTGTGCYSYYLMMTMCLTIFSMTMDIFSFSVVVGGSRCELPLDIHQKSILISMPFLGPVITCYGWGYLSDTTGRRRCLSLAMWGSFIASSLVALSPHYAVSGVLKFISSSFCSCAQSTIFALLGESTSQRVRGPFMLMVNGFLNMCYSAYLVPAFFILNAEFSFPVFGYVVLPWRVLAFVVALPMAISGILLQFVYESPKFLANAGRKEEAIEVLAKIWWRNGNKGKYPVDKLEFTEDSNISSRSQPLLASLMHQTLPLFKPPLLFRTLQLLYLNSMLFSINNGLFIWFPFIAESFFNGLLSTDEDTAQGLCLMIDKAKKVDTTDEVACTTHIETNTVYGLLGQGFSFFVIMLVLSIVTARGMVACLGTIVARASSLISVNVIGVHFLENCSITIYACTAYLFSGLLVSLFLPPDRPGQAQH